MAQYQFRAADAEGKVVEGTIEAAESSAVVARLQDRGLIPIRIGAVTDARAGAPAGRAPAARPFQRKPGARHLLIITQELAALLTAGLPLDRSLGTLVDLADHPEVKRILDEVLTAVRGGKSLADALAQHRFFPTLYVSMVRAGEMGGFLESVLQRLADYLDRAHALRAEVRNALTYPVVLTLVLGGSLVFLLVVVLPRFSELFDDMGAAIPLPAKMVMGLSDLVRGYWWAGLILLAIGAFAFRRSLRTPAGRLRWDQTKLRIPVLGLILRKLEAATLTRTLGTLMRSGVPMIQALETVRAIAGNVVIANAVGEVEVGVREGAGVANPLARTGAFPPLAVQMISVGEESGKLDEMLLKIADYYDREVRMQIDQFMGLLEPLLILVMGLLVGTVVVSMLMAIFSVNDFAM